MAKTTRLDIDNCATPEEVEAWAAAEEKPYLEEMARIDAAIVALNAEKRELHRNIEMIQADSAARRYDLRGPDAGPDQMLIPDGSLTDQEIERLRRVIDQHDRNR
jgi:hypothetical protein